MKTEVKPVAENEVELAVEVPRDDVEAKIERTISRLARERPQEVALLVRAWMREENPN